MRISEIIIHENEDINQRPMLTLKHLHALRKIRERDAAKQAEHLELIKQIYGADDDCEKDDKNKEMKPIKPVKTVKAFRLFKPKKKDI